MYGIIYKLTNTINNKFYIGQTISSLDRRWSEHVSSARQNKPWVICNAIRKYGADSFTREIIASADSKEELNTLEISYIAELSPHYNMTIGGGGLGSPSQEVREKISTSGKSRQFTDEHKKNISKGLKGREVKEATRKKLSDMFKGKSLRKSAMSQKEIDRLIANNKARGKGLSLRDPEIDKAMEGMSKNEKISYRAKLDRKRVERMSGDKNPMYGKKRTLEEKDRKSTRLNSSH